MDVWKKIITLLIPVYPRAVYTWGAVLWAVLIIIEESTPHTKGVIMV